MFRCVGQHIDQGVAALGGSADGLGVVAIRKDLASTFPVPVESPCHAALDSVHGARESLLALSLAEEVNVVALDRELDDAEAFPLADACQVVEEERNGLGVAKGGKASGDATGDVHDTTTGSLS